MFNIEKELQGLEIIKRQPSDAVKQRTLQMATTAVQKKTHQHRVKRRIAWVTPCAAAVVMAVLFLFFVPAIAMQGTSYYTIDINPSISIQVDRQDNVVSVSPENDDATNLLHSMDLTGVPFKTALQTIVQAAATQKYLKQDGHILVAHFGNEAGISQQELETIVQACADSSVKCLLLESDTQHFQQATREQTQAGIALLRERARNMNMANEDVDDIIGAMVGKKNDNAADNAQNENAHPSSAVNVEQNNGNNENGNSDNNGNRNSDNDNSNNGNRDNSNTDNSKPDNSNTDNSNTDNSNTDNSKPDNSNTDNSNTDNSNTDNSKPDNSKPDNSKPDNSNTDNSNTDNSNTDNSNTDNSNSNPINNSANDDNTGISSDERDDNVTNNNEKETDGNSNEQSEPDKSSSQSAPKNMTDNDSDD